MNARTVDILIWRSSGFYDTLSDVVVQLKGLHCGIILVGEQFSKLSVCGNSPSQTYVTFMIDKLFPVEEIIGNIWLRPNGAALYHIRRTGGPDVSERTAFLILSDLLLMKKRSIYSSIYIAVAAYFKMGGIAPGTGYDHEKWQVCSLFVGYLLERFGLLTHDAVVNNLIPLDFYNLGFYQKYEYRRVELFDKGTTSLSWLFTCFYIRTGHIIPRPISHPFVNYMLEKYNYPRYDRTKYRSTQNFLTGL